MCANVSVHISRYFLFLFVIFANRNRLCNTANTLKTKTKKAVILSLDCPFFRGKRGINAVSQSFGSQWVAVVGVRVVLRWYCLVIFGDGCIGGE